MAEMAIALGKSASTEKQKLIAERDTANASPMDAIAVRWVVSTNGDRLPRNLRPPKLDFLGGRNRDRLSKKKCKKVFQTT